MRIIETSANNAMKERLQGDKGIRTHRREVQRVLRPCAPSSVRQCKQIECPSKGRFRDEKSRGVKWPSVSSAVAEASARIWVCVWEGGPKPVPRPCFATKLLLSNLSLQPAPHSPPRLPPLHIITFLQTTTRITSLLRLQWRPQP